MFFFLSSWFSLSIKPTQNENQTMTSIPADRGLNLGQIVPLWRIRQLQAIAELQNPVDLANDRLNNLTLSNYKIAMVFQQMVNMKVNLFSLGKLRAEMFALKAEMADAAIDLGAQIMIAERAIRALKAKVFKQTKITAMIESPIDFSLSKCEQFPLSFDSLKFDVQFFQVQTSADASTAFANSVSSYVGQQFSGSDQATSSMSAAASAHTTALSQVNTSRLEGTIVICAFASHKQMDIISPLVLDPEKAVHAWNSCFPLDRLRTNPIEMLAAAVLENPLSFGAINILTGAAKSSSFVGYVHLLKTEITTQTQYTASVAASVQESLENAMAISSYSGKFSANRQASTTVNALLSTARIQAQCSLHCEGIIPSIVSNEVSTTVQNLKPDPSAVMQQLGAISNASSTEVNTGMATAAAQAATGSQFIELNNSYISEVVQSLGEEDTIKNKVIDPNSLMTAFEDYVQKAQEGNCGVPTAYYLKQLTKADVAKCYIRRFYPNGAATQAEARAGQLGTTPEGGNKEE